MSKMWCGVALPHLIAGFIANKFVNRTSQGFLLEIVLGIVGGVVGGFGSSKKSAAYVVHRLRLA